MNRLNDGTYYVNITFNVNINFNVITITDFIYIHILNEHVHMLGKKTGVLFTISLVNFELKQGNNIDPCSFSEFPAGVLSLSLSLSLLSL